ncbi:hypothetical protein C2G38_2176247 [Gigaspora rosea]|uniref:Methyltransferase domain-containing protein n=1 Tax=Gigaspora rosea TaxID=44941 RepID=A0A397VGH4_9GLOM|nr:hypothetical protein C2G38_2176247 [Gigaspora rosea]
MREEEKSIVKLLNLDYGLFYTNRRFTLSNPIFDDGELKLEKYTDDLLVYKPKKKDENSLESWCIFEQTFSTLNIQSSKPQRKTFNLSENDIGLLIPILIIEYCGKPNVTFQSIINMESQSNEPDFLWIGEFFAKKVLVGGALVIKDVLRYSHNSLEQTKSLIIKSVNKFRYANKNLSKEIIDSKQLYIHIEDFDGNLLKNIEMLQLYEFKKATVFTYDEVIPTYTFLDAGKQQICFNKRLVPGISTYHEECSMSVWIGIQQLIRECKLEHGLITRSNEFIPSLYPAVELKFEPSIKLLNTATKFNISHLSTQKELFYITRRIDIFNNKFNLLDKMPFVTVKNNSQINSLHCGIICEKIEMYIKDVIKPSQQLEIEVEKALENNNPYKELEKVFAKYEHVFCIKFSMGGILTKLNEFPLTESEIKNVSNNKFDDIESHQETLNAWLNLLDQFKMDKNMYIIEKSLSNVRNDYNTIVVSNDNIDNWAKSVSKNLDAWQVVNLQQFIPLYKLFNNSLQKEIDFLLSNENRILMTGISKLKNNEIRYYYEKFNQPLESDEYQVIGSIISDGLEEVNLIVSFQMLTVSGFSIIIEELDNKSSMKPIANDLKVYWQLIGNPLSTKYFSKNNRNIRVITGKTPNIMLTHEKINQRINLEKTKEYFTSNCIIATSFEFSPINFSPKFEVTLESWSNKCINLNINNHSFKEINKYLKNELLEPEKINCNLIWYVIYTTQQETITDDELHQILWKYLGQYLNLGIQECLDGKKDEHKAFIYYQKSANIGHTQDNFPTTVEKRINRFSKKSVIPTLPIFNEDENLRYPLHDTDDIIMHSQLQHNIHRYIWQRRARVLEIGCGDGTWTIDLAKEFTWSLFTAIDTHSRFDRRVENTNVTFLKADVLDDKVANEIVRVCKPGGWIEIMNCTNQYAPKGSATTQLESVYHEYLKSKNIDLIILNPRFEDYLRSTNKIIVIRKEEKKVTLGKGGGKVGPLLLQNIITTWEQSKKTLSELMGISEKILYPYSNISKRSQRFKNFYKIHKNIR